MRKRRLFFICSLTVLLAGACQQEKLDIQTPSYESPSLDESAVPGTIRVELSDGIALGLIEVIDAQGNVPADKIPSFDGALDGLNITGMRTTFHIGGKFRPLQIEYGLHRWFDISYDSEITLTKAVGDFNEAGGILNASRVYRPVSMGVQMNDPRFGEQWHYYNTGQGSGWVSGVDIKLQQAWDTYRVFGRPEVVVAVMDSGVDYAHEDLAANMWVNPGEIPGNGLDDDNNGYVDDVYGYNFVTQSDGKISPEGHGTHVAGTIAAVNNNNIGVCGIAGGNGPEGNGVRIMSVQILDNRYKDATTNYNKALQYAAENGAIISQNSWGYLDVHGNPIDDPNAFEAERRAIVYFNDNAGKFAGSPMTGGICIFAAGNSNADTGYPARFDEALAVAAIGPSGDAASYTNYGEWIDVCAPGGDTDNFGTRGGVLSTTINNTYSFYQGTSMACPHVSGLAALMVSASGGNGYTAEKLRNDLINSCDESIYDHVSMSRQGLLGKGVIDALMALSSLNTEAPQVISQISYSVISNTVTITADVPTDDGGTTDAYYYHVYYSTSPFDNSNLVSASKATFTIGNLETVEGSLRKFMLQGLDFDTTYYIAVSAGDFAGNESDITEVFTCTTGSNTAPVLQAMFESPLTVKSSEKKVLSLTVSDDDGHKVTVTTTDKTGNVTVSQEGMNATIVIDGTAMTPGNYSFTINATDEFGLSGKGVDVEYEVLKNNPPVLIKPIESFAVNGNGARSVLDASAYFSDPDGETFDNTLTLIFSDFDSKIIGVTQEGPRITFTGKNSGHTSITLKVADARGASVSTKFNVVVRNKEVEMDVYPNPTVDYLYVRTGSKVEGIVEIFTSNGLRIYSAQHTINLNEPLKLDVRALAPGSYSIVVADNMKAQFVKL